MKRIRKITYLEVAPPEHFRGKLGQKGGNVRDNPEAVVDYTEIIKESLYTEETLPLEDELHLPASLKLKLFDHQLYGINWLYGLYRHGKGGILADDMGLGKVCVFL